ncbi:glycosyltransferase [Lentisphaera profundi]|uniref:Glycosyltransferase n=1 Tax=Lentisphaera profundi TaxID=1658616 RepID=A0ABY7W4F0_9BACT|nr:glycosyltransferase [Lentisphaera profundi]WDE99118.1 glycosyltransferase [Lentisphaera profundi]
MNRKNVLLLCHSYSTPFLSVAVQYSYLFEGKDINLVVVFIKGEPSTDVADELYADKVLFLNQSTASLKGLKQEAIKKLRAINDSYNFDFCVAHRYKSMYISLRCGIYTIGVSHIDGVFSGWKRKLFAYYFKDKLSLLGVSKAIRDDMRKSLPLFPEEKIDFLYNSLNFDKIREAQLSKNGARSFLGLSEDVFVFANVGRVHEDKDQKTLIKAFSLVSEKMPSAILIIVGEGRLMSALKAQVQELNLESRVKLLGNIPEAVKYFKAFDCFVLSSIREGLPVAILEAYAAKVPPIASLCNGNTEAIEGLNVGFPIGDAQALSELLLSSYERSEIDKEVFISKIDEKIEKYFTAEAVNIAFWKLRVIQSLVDTDIEKV